jgi:hypothetical protein
MADENTPDEASTLAQELLVKYLERGAKTDFEPYVNLIGEGFDRCMKLVIAAEPENEMSSEILRAVVVLNHAYLEDFMRTLALSFLPTANESALDRVPFAGHGQTDRAEKFFLGKLAQHRGKTVDGVIRESVSRYMDRFTFNSVTEIISFLESIGLKLPDGKDKNPKSIPELPVTDEILRMLDAMMQRRHQIAHRADKSTDGRLQDIRSAEVLGWLVATLTFTLSTAQTAFMKRYSFEEFKKRVEAMKAQIERATRQESHSSPAKSHSQKQKLSRKKIQ